MKTVFFEVQPWEQGLLREHLPDVILSHERLNKDSYHNYKDAEILSVFIYSSVTKEIIDGLPKLRCIATRSTGFDHIDIEYAKSKGIAVCNVPEYGSDTVAEHTFALILSLTRRIYQSVNQTKNLNFEHSQIRGIDLCGKTLGIVGLGKIGLQMIRMAQGFKMKVLVFNRSQDAELARKLDFTYTDFDFLLSHSDIVSLHLPLTNETRHIINTKNVKLFKKHSYLINTARGGLIDAEAIMVGLERGIFDGVGLDVLEGEKELDEEVALLNSDYRRAVDLKTLVFDHMLIHHPKVLITPHNAFNSDEALQRIIETTLKNVQAFKSGKVVNAV